jgi:hypothetical protein
MHDHHHKSYRKVRRCGEWRTTVLTHRAGNEETTRPPATRARRAGNTTRDDPLWPIACHEAAHAVVAAMLGVLGDNSRITIEPEGFEKGSVEFSKDGNNDAWKQWGVRYTRKAIRAYYAGLADRDKRNIPNISATMKRVTNNLGSS